MRPITLKLLEKNVGVYVLPLVLAIVFGYVSSGMENKSKQVKPDQTEKICRVKEIINKIKRQPTELERIFANDKELISKIYKDIHGMNKTST